MSTPSKPTILFMGTPEFAVPSLEILREHQFPIIAVVTQPDRPRGRGKVITAPPVKRVAEQHHIPVIQPERVREETFLSAFRSIAPDMVVLAAFGQILPKSIIDFPRWGCLNVHPSLLPKYRGAAPINWTLICGEVKTGVTIMQMDEGLDSGDILLQRETAIRPDETFGDLHDRLSLWGGELLLEAIGRIMSGTVQRIPQEAAQATYASKLNREDTQIRWDTDVHRIACLIRGLSPVPGAFTMMEGRQFKILKAAEVERPVSDPPGTVGSPTPCGLPVAARNGHVYLQEVQMESKRQMVIDEFLRGHVITGKRLG